MADKRLCEVARQATAVLGGYVYQLDHNDRTLVFIHVVALTAKRGAERAKFLKEEADRHALNDKVGKALAAATDTTGVIAALYGRGFRTGLSRSANRFFRGCC